MRRICLLLEYEGTHYHGWQIQPDVVTVQEVLERSLSAILGEKTRVFGAGRTDAGVHALGQVAHFVTESTIDVNALFRAINSLLPHDIVARAVIEVDATFHARKSALKKRYEYWIRNDPLRSVFTRRFMWHLKVPLDLESMRKGARCFVGEHDFSSFQAAGCEAGINPVRTISHLEIEMSAGKALRISVEGNSFLRHMVRNIVGTLVEVGTGRIRVESISGILAAGDRRKAGRTAPAKGLFLKWIEYPDSSGIMSDNRDI